MSECDRAVAHITDSADSIFPFVYAFKDASATLDKCRVEGGRVLLRDDLFVALTGKGVGAGKSARREAARVEFRQSVLLFPIKGRKTQPAEMADTNELSRKGLSLVVGQSLLRADDTFAVRLLTMFAEPVLVRCVVRRVYPLDPLHSTVGADFVTLLKDGRAAIR